MSFEARIYMDYMDYFSQANFKTWKYNVTTGNILQNVIDTAFIHLKGFRSTLWT